MLTDGVVGSRLRIGVWVVAEDRDRAFDRSEETTNPLRERTRIVVPVVTVDARITDRSGAQIAATVPDITRTAVVPRPGGSFDFRETFRGLGDTSVLGWYRLSLPGRWTAVLNGGASLPTGRTERPRFRPALQSGSLVPMSRLQRGSGTVDPLFGITADRRAGALTVFGSVAARMPIVENGFGLRTGASWEVNAGVARQLGTHRLAGLARLGWLHRRQDVFNGTPVLVGGGDWLYLTPGVTAQVGGGVSVQAEVKLPIHRSLANQQLDSPAVFQFGISRNLF